MGMAIEDFGAYMRQMLLGSRAATEATIQGCSDDEIEALMAGQGVTFLPELYRSFLKHMGRRAGYLFAGRLFSCERLIDVKHEANFELKNSPLTFRFPTDAFVFLSEDGYADWFFLTASRDNDPPVYVYSIGESYADELGKRLSQFLIEQVVQIPPYLYLSDE